MIETLPKLGNELPNTDEPERIAATLIVQWRGVLPGFEVPQCRVWKTQLKPVWTVDFYRGRPE